MESFKKRFATKIATGLMGTALTISLTSLISRALGPENLGNIDFVAGVGQSFLNFMTLSIPQALIYWIPKSRSPKGLASVFTFTCLSYLVFSGCLLTLTIQPHFGHFFENAGVPRSVMVLGLALAFATFLQQIMSNFADSVGVTISIEINKLIGSILKFLGAICLLFYLTFSTQSWLILQIAVVLFSVIFTAKVLFKRGYLRMDSFDFQELKDFALYSKSFAASMFVYSAFSIFYDMSEKYILQINAGSEQFGYFSFSQRIANVIFLISNSFTPLLMNKYLIARKEMANDKIIDLTERSKIIITLVCSLVMFSIFNCEIIIRILGGQSFQNAKATTFIYLLYPIHQTFSMFFNTLLLVLDRRNLYIRIGIINMIISVGLTYFLTAGPNAFIPGLGLGALGFALKAVGTQIILNNVYLYFVMKELRSDFGKWIKYQIAILLIGAGCGYASTLAFTGEPAMIITQIIVLGMRALVFGLLMAIIVRSIPSLIGMRSTEDFDNLIKDNIQVVMRLFKKKSKV